MLTSRSFLAAVQAVQAPVFQFSGLIRGGLLIAIENHSEANAITYKVQTSADGVSWADAAFQTLDNQEVVSFVLDPESAHTFRFNPTTLHTRLMAAGAANAEIGLLYSTSNDPSEPLHTFA